MERQIKTHNDYAIAAFAFSLLSLVGSFLSLINTITLMTTYQLLQDAKANGLSQKQDKMISILYEIALFLTLCFTVLYLTIQF